jgi:thiol-disulfide isomerase/thioredoxin
MQWRASGCAGLACAAVLAGVAPAAVSAAPPAAATPVAATAARLPVAATAARPPGEVPIGAPLREAVMSGLNGPSRRLSEFRGKPLVINVWASWCGPCRGETASLERLAWRDESRHFAIIGISTDDYRDRAQSWLRESNATISHFIDRQLELETMLGASRLPLTVFVDAQGRVLARVYGAKEWDGPEALAFVRRTFAIR